MFKNNFLRGTIYPAAVFAGGMVGVGFFSLPYLAAQTNIWLMFGYFVVLTSLVVAVNLMFAEVSLRTPDFKRFPGFARYHLGRWGQLVAMIFTILGSYGVLLACLIVGSRFLYAILNPIIGGTLLTYTLVYIFMGSVAIFFGIKIIKRIELVILALLVLAVLVVFAEGYSFVKLENIFVSQPLDMKDWILPFGPILFALWGIGMIPEIEEMLIGQKINLKRIILISTIAVSIMYFLFIILVLGMSGGNTTESAFLGLDLFLGRSAVMLSLFMGTLATLTGFITQGIATRNTFIYDLGVRHWQAVVFTCLVPLILLLLGVNSYVYLISLVGGLFLGTTGILILLMYKKIGGKNIAVYPLLFIFLVGIAYQLISFINR